MVGQHLKIGQNRHQQSRIVLIVRDQPDELLEGFLLLIDGPTLEHLDEVALLWGFNHGIVVDDEVAVSACFVDRHIENIQLKLLLFKQL